MADKNPFDFFGDLDDETLNQFKETLKKQQKTVPSKADLIGKINDLLEKKDKKLMGTFLADNSYYIYCADAIDLYKKHVTACLFIENNDLAVQSLNKVSKNYKNISELLGMIYYSVKNYGKAADYFSTVENPARRNTTTLAKSISNYLHKSIDEKTCEQEMSIILNSSPQANNFLGTVFFNNKSYEKAQDYFTQEVILTKGAESSRLNSLKALYAIDKSAAINNFGNFLYETQSKLNAKELSDIMSKNKMDIPHYRICLYQIADAILIRI